VDVAPVLLNVGEAVYRTAGDHHAVEIGMEMSREGVDTIVSDRFFIRRLQTAQRFMIRFLVRGGGGHRRRLLRRSDRARGAEDPYDRETDPNATSAFPH
jgi:hypothetical protein